MQKIEFYLWFNLRHNRIMACGEVEERDDVQRITLFSVRVESTESMKRLDKLKEEDFVFRLID